MKESRKFIPFSGRRYYATPNGCVYYTSTSELVKVNENETGLFVELEWFNGKQQYSVGLIMLITFGVLPPDDYFWNNITVLYRDNDVRNLSISNLLYKFTELMPCDGYDGYYHIPHYTNYGITKFGEIVNVKTGEKKRWGLMKGNEIRNSKGGYRYTRVVSDLGKTKVLFQHRALCFVFKDYLGNIEKLVVNHLDGEPDNNDLDNLELITPYLNNAHALDSGLRVKIKPVLMRDLTTGLVTRFNSAAACAKSLGYSGGCTIRSRIDSGDIYEDLYQFKYDDDSDWKDVDLEKVNIIRVGTDTEMVALNIFDKVVTRFISAVSGEHITGVPAATIRYHAKRNSNIPVNGYLFRYQKFGEPFPNLSEKQILFFKESRTRGYAIDCVDLITGEETFFTSIEKAMLHFNMGYSKIRFVLLNGGILNKRYKLSRFNPFKT